MGVSTPKRGLCKSSGIAVSRGAARKGAPRARASRPGFVIAIAALILFVTAIIGFAINATGLSGYGLHGPDTDTAKVRL